MAQKTPLSDAIDDYRHWRKSQGFARQTLANEKSVLLRFLALTGNIYVSSVNERHITEFFTEASRTRGAGAQALDHSVLRGFFEWARQTRRCPSTHDPMFGRRKPRVAKRERNRVHVSQFDHLLDVAGAHDPRDRAAVAILIYLLIRDQELASLRVGDVDLDAGFVRVVVTKSSLEDDMPICAELDAELRLWLDHYASVVGPLTPDMFLIPRRIVESIGERDALTGRIEKMKMRYDPSLPISRNRGIVRRALEGSGFPVTDHRGRPAHEGAHTLRRSGARALFDRLCADGYDGALRIVQSMLHHSSISITERYIGITADKHTRNDILKGKVMYAKETLRAVN